MTGRWFLLSCGGLVLVRMCLAAHAPAAVDAHAGLAALVLGMVAGVPRTALVVAGLVIASAAVSVPMSWDPWLSLIALPAILGPAAMFLVASSGAARPALLGGLTAAGALHAAAALVQRFHTWPDALRRMGELGLDAAAVARLTSQRPLGFTVSPDLAAGMSMAAACAALALTLEVRDPRIKRAAAASALLSLGALLVFRSFGSALALLAGGACAGVVAWARPHERRGPLVLGGAAAVGVIGVGVAAMARGLDSLAVSAGERLENWRAALAILENAPLWGVGFMRFPAAYLVERSPGSNITRYAHSGPLQVLAESGVIGAALLGAALVVAAWAFIVRVRRASLTSSDLVLLCGAIAALLRTLIDYDAQIAQTASTVALLWGLLLAYPTPEPAPALQRRALGLCVLLVVPLVPLLAWREHVIAESRADAREEGVASYLRAFPHDVEPALALAKLRVDRLGACTDEDSCGVAGRAALEVLDPLCSRAHPPAAAFLLRAHAHLASHELRKALDDADAALRAHPGQESAHLLGIVTARTLGLDVRAREEAARRWGVAPPE